MEDFMFSLLVDSYLDYMEAIDGIDRDEYWLSMALNQYTGKPMDDKYFMFTYADRVLDEQVLDATYTYLIDKDYPKDYPLESIVPYLATRYYIFKYDEVKNEVMNSIERDEVQEIVKKFIDDYDYGMEIVREFYESFMSNNKYNSNANHIQENGDSSVIVKLNRAYMDVNVQTLNEILRNVVVNLFNFYISNGYGNKEALDMTWLYFTDNFDPLGELDQRGIDFQAKMAYKRLMLGLIFGDLLEDFRKEEVEEMPTYEDRLIACMPRVMSSLGIINIPNDEEVRNALLERFIFLQDDEERRISNRRHTYDEGMINELRRLNPSYFLDEFKFKKS